MKLKKIPNISPIERPLIVDQKLIDPNWLSGYSIGCSAEKGVFMLDLNNQQHLN